MKPNNSIAVLDPAPVDWVRIRTAAYCRVSTGSEDQSTSIEGQMSHYTSLIADNPAWEFAGLYCDIGLSGTKSESRPQLQRLIRDCEHGRIDLILTKSISRFARSTTDCLRLVRHLSQLGVHLYFEEENINTAETGEELLLSILASLAEEESHSISGNVTWSIRQRFLEGNYRYSRAPYGYTLEDGNLVPLPEEAAIVRRIFSEALSGKGSPTIAGELNREGVPTKAASEETESKAADWHAQTINRMLQNVLYTGDLLSQKTYHDEHFFRRVNRGERDQYYFEDHHPALVDRETFDRVQALISQHAKEFHNTATEDGDNPRQRRYCFTGKLFCGCCGSRLKRVSQKTSAGTRFHWSCRRHIQDRDACPLTRVLEEEIQNRFVTMVNKLSFAAELIFPLYLEGLPSGDALAEAGKLYDLVRKQQGNEFSPGLFLTITEYAQVFPDKIIFHLACGLALTEYFAGSREDRE